MPTNDLVAIFQGLLSADPSLSILTAAANAARLIHALLAACRARVANWYPHRLSESRIPGSTQPPR